MSAVPDTESAQPKNETGAAEKIPLTARLLLLESLSARRAAGIIAGFTLVIAVAGGLLERVVDRHEFHTIGKGLWFSLETVTTVGYGDVVPHQTAGRIIAVVIMLSGIGFLAVITAAVTAALIESSRRRFAAREEAELEGALQQVTARLERIEAALGVPKSARRGDDAG